MAVQRLMRLVKYADGLMGHVRWKGLQESEDTVEPVEKVYEDFPQLLVKLLAGKNTPVDLAAEARRTLHN